MRSSGGALESEAFVRDVEIATAEHGATESVDLTRSVLDNKVLASTDSYSLLTVRRSTVNPA